MVNDVVASNNSQVASRVNPRLIDLLAAVATGAVGSIALVRRDISDTLPGVAIAISLVPPLSVVGLTAEAGAIGQAAGALLLFGTDVAAILTSGIIVMAIYRVHRLVDPAPIAERTDVNRRNAVLVIVALFVVIGIPLTVSSLSIGRNTARESRPDGDGGLGRRGRLGAESTSRPRTPRSRFASSARRPSRPRRPSGSGSRPKGSIPPT